MPMQKKKSRPIKGLEKREKPEKSLQHFNFLALMHFLYSILGSDHHHLQQNFLCNMLLHSKGGQNMYLGQDANSSLDESNNINIPFSCSHDVLSFVKPKPQKMPPFNSYSDRNQIHHSKTHLTQFQYFKAHLNQFT